MEPEHEDLAREIKHCFIGLMRTMRGAPNYARDPVTLNNIAVPALDKVLSRAVSLCLESRATADIYVRAQNQYFVPSLKAFKLNEEFYPNVLINSQAVANVERFRKESQIPLQIEDCIYIQKQYLTGMLTRTDRSVESILLDDAIDFTPWFRILVTTKPNQKIIAKYRRQARALLTVELEMYLKQQEYKDGTPFDLSRISS